MRTAASSLAERFGYRRIDTPVLAAAEPPGRSGAIIRAYFAGGLAREVGPARLYYLAPIVSGDEETWQFGVEVVGDASPDLDAEVIELGWRWFETLRIVGIRLHVRGSHELVASLRMSALAFTHTEDSATSFTYTLSGDHGILLAAGDRHDRLATDLGLPPAPAVGSAVDLNKTAEVLRRHRPMPPSHPDVYAIAIELASRPYVHRIVAGLRQRGYRVIFDTSRDGLQAALERARRWGAPVAVMAGTSLQGTGQVLVRDVNRETEVTAWEAQVGDEVRRVFARAHQHQD